MKSIKTKGILYVFSILSIVFMMMLLISHSYIKEWAINQNKNYIQEKTETVEKLTEKYINLYINPIKKLSEEPEIKSMNWEEQKKIIEELRFLDYLSIAIVDKNGQTFYTNGDILDLSDRGYIQKALAGEFNISPVITSRITDEPVMMIGQPIYRENVVVGTIIAKIKTKFLTDFIDPNTKDIFSIYFALDEAGNVVLHSEEKYQLERFNFSNFNEESYGYEGLVEMVDKTKNSSTGFESFKKVKENFHIGYSSIDILNWKFYLGSSESDIVDSIEQLNIIFKVMGTILITITVIIAWFITRAFVNPVIELSNLFKRAASGELTVRSNYRANDELGEASRSFNQMMSQIKTLTYFDPVTGLPNRQVFTKDLNERIEESKDMKKIMIIETRHFSKINERFGYQTGDIILRKISKRIIDVLPHSVPLYRGKGNQFIALFSKKSEADKILSISKKIVNKIKEPIEMGEEKVSLMSRIGIAEFPENGKDAENLIKKAVFASNYLKKKEAGSIQIFKEELYDEDLEIRNLVNKLDDALEHNKLYMKYQPIYNLEKMSIEGIEALIRWEDPVKGNISPGDFIPIAEKNGLIEKLDYWVIQEVFRQINQWQSQGLPLVKISINISSQTFENDTFEKWLCEEVSKYSIDTELIELELTERIILNDIDASIKKFRKLRTKGFKIAIDDFGVGYSSLSYLVKLPIDHLKIDRSFIKDLRSSKESRIIVRTLVNMAKDLGIKAVAEGIETQEEVDYLLSISCQNGQGFYLDLPLIPKDLETVLGTIND